MHIWGVMVFLSCLVVSNSFTPRVVFREHLVNNNLHMKSDDELERIVKENLVDMQWDPDFDIEEAEKIFAQVFPPSVCKTIKKRAIKEKIRLNFLSNRYFS